MKTKLLHPQKRVTLAGFDEPVFGPVVFLLTEIFSYLAFKYFGFERTRKGVMLELVIYTIHNPSGDTYLSME
jgi:hypothetical protein